VTNRPDTLLFEGYSFDTTTKSATFHYVYDGGPRFQESFTFDFDISDINDAALDIALRHLFVMAGISYYKLFLPPKVMLKSIELSEAEASFFEETYQRGLRELFYTNGLPIDHPVQFPRGNNAKTPNVELEDYHGSIIGIGGGKDSLTSLEMLRKDKSNEIATWSLGHRQKLMPLVRRMGTKHYYVDRAFDYVGIKSAIESGGYQGHIAFSAILACVGTVVCVLSGRSTQIVSNESSADEPTITVSGLEVNHQYSKSSAFEKSYQVLLQQFFGKSIDYYSLLRDKNELGIAHTFVQTGAWYKYKDVFYSCNTGFQNAYDKAFWCGNCAKCAFTYLILYQFVDRQDLERVFGEDLLGKESLVPIYRELLGLSEAKPFDCVGTIAESRQAMTQTYTTRPELSDRYGNLSNDKL
jgi:UDP-N-acetyl-alpha-D-muramoyl-L-alanyl-L-glutamate epimerase